MKTVVLPIGEPESIDKAYKCLLSGGLVAFPTDTVYGLGALAFDGAAVEGLFAAKDRPVEKSVPVLIGDLDDLGCVSLEVPVMAARLAARFWPGPLTLVLPRHPDLPRPVSATSTVGVRLPDHAAARALLRRVGPMAVTSANMSGRLSPSTAEEVLGQLQGRIALVLDGGRSPGGVPSTVVDCVAEQPKQLRQGPISWNEIMLALGENF